MKNFLEREIAPNIVQRQYCPMLVGSWNYDVDSGTESFSLAFRRRQVTLQTEQETESTEKLISSESIEDLMVSTDTIMETISTAGPDPVTGADLSQVSRAGLVTLIKRLYEEEVLAAQAAEAEEPETEE